MTPTTRAADDEEHTDQVSEPDEKENLIDRESARVVEETDSAHDETVKIDDVRLGDAEDSVMTNVGVTDPQGGTYSGTGGDGADQGMRDSSHSVSPERDIEPSIHPATCALYIKNFMRPLRPQAVQDHLLELATPANAPFDSSIISNFYLDNIRTHAFAVFTSVSAASRVRTALHKRVWPDETNRKALWIDFIPPECFEDWIDTEQQARDRGNMPRYEVVYDHDNDGSTGARLSRCSAGSQSLHPDWPIAPFWN
ncbi:hypothetical protein NUW58_g10913 [Xylaria curta]|uniref:Uncharacterized protein n=1 Tax=Xylaria curta TaxID=42375 RepID=A0ACC1MG26_9PEZI|nr:hypothetical protein NUW58_g10913 [Xylaria curta]